MEIAIINERHDGKARYWTWPSLQSNLLNGILSWFFPSIFIASPKIVVPTQTLMSYICGRKFEHGHNEKEISWSIPSTNLPSGIPSWLFPFVFIFSRRMELVLEEANTKNQELMISHAPGLRQGHEKGISHPNNLPSGIPSCFFPFVFIFSLKIHSILEVAKPVEQKLLISHAPKLCQRLWSDLPDVLLCEIFSRLLPRDRAVFQSICRSWNSIGDMVTQRAELPKDLKSVKYPYLMFSNNRVFDLISENCRLMSIWDISGLRALSGSSYGNFHYMDFLYKQGAIIRVAKDGWLLMSIDHYELFFYNPWSRKKVQLPFLQGYTMSMYFSSPPTSKDWFVVVIALTTSNDIALYTTKSGDDSWKCCKFLMKENPLFLSFCNAVVFEGMYYFLGEDAKLLIHDPITKQFYYHEAPEYIRLYASGGDQYMLVTDDGKLLVVFEGCDGSSIRVCQWNPLKVIWETVESLGDKVLFVSRSQSLCIKAIIKGTENRIYFPRLVGSHCVFYSLATKKLHTSTFSMDTSYDNFLGIKEYKDATWMI